MERDRLDAASPGALRAAKLARCEALSVTPSDYNRWLGAGTSTRDVRAMAADAGVRITFVRWAEDWRPRLPGGAFPVETIAFDADDFLRMAAALEVESPHRLRPIPARTLRDPRARRLVRGARPARRDRGPSRRPRVHSGLGIPDLRSAWSIVRGADAANTGTVLDLWHYMRGGRDDALPRSIPGDRITAVQLCDATAEVPPGMSLAEDGLENRRAPGEGAFPVDEIVAVLRETGGLNDVGLEIFSPAFDAMSADTIGALSLHILDTVLPPKG